MKKFLDFVLSFVQPKKMIRYRNVNLFLSVVILLACTLLCAGASNLTMRSYIKRNKENFRLFEEVYDLETSDSVRLPQFSLDEEKLTLDLDTWQDGENSNNIYDFSFDLTDGKKLKLTLVYEPQVYSQNIDDELRIDERYLKFDINSYYQAEPVRNNDGDLIEEDMLMIVTNEFVYYLYNHGYDYAKNEQGEYTRYLESTGWNILEEAYYLPASAEEIVYSTAEPDKLDYSKWTKQVLRGTTTNINGQEYEATRRKDEIAYFLPDNASEIVSNEYCDAYNNNTNWTKIAKNGDTTIVNGIEYQARTRLNTNFYEVFVSDNSSRVGVFTLYKVQNYGIEMGKLNGENSTVSPSKVVECMADIMVSMGVEQFQSYNFIYALIFVFIMPLLWTAATWLMSKKYGELTRFKEYYAICAVSFIVPSILIAIFTMIVEPYVFIAQWAMLIQVAFYIFCIFKMNGKNDKIATPPSNYNSLKEVVLDVEATPIVMENDSKPAELE